MDKHQSSLIILACLVISVVAMTFILLTRGQQPKVPAFVTSVIGETSYALPAAKANASQETTVGSPDGKLALKMTEEKGKENVTYVFSILNSGDGSQKEIFRKTVPTSSTMVIPLNTFSPDDRYLFLKEADAGGTSYLVLSVSGAALTKNSQTLEIVSLFNAKYPNYKITDATGWGGVNLVVFNTDKSSGGQGPSFWFEAPGGGFIQLGTRFN